MTNSISISMYIRPEHFGRIPGNRFAFESLGKNPQLGQVSLSLVDVYPCHALGEDMYKKREKIFPLKSKFQNYLHYISSCAQTTCPIEMVGVSYESWHPGENFKPKKLGRVNSRVGQILKKPGLNQK